MCAVCCHMLLTGGSVTTECAHMDEGAGSCILAAGVAWVDEILYTHLPHVNEKNKWEREKSKFSSKVVWTEFKFCMWVWWSPGQGKSFLGQYGAGGCWSRHGRECVRQTLSVNFKITASEAVTITVTFNDHFSKFTVTDNHQQKQEEKKYVCFVVLRAEPKAPRTS